MSLGKTYGMRIGVDLDGVVASFSHGWATAYQQDFGGEFITEDKIVGWNINELTHFKSMNEFWTWMRNSHPQVFRHLPLYPGAKEALTRLHNYGHDIVIITTKPDWAMECTKVWLEENDIPHKELHITHNKAEVPRCSVYIDDGVHNLEALVAAHPESLVVRWVQPWNHPVEGAVDCTTWWRFQELIGYRERAAYVV